MERALPVINPKLPRFFYGGDYNPDQWPPETWDEDMRLMRLANVNVATVGVFSWVWLQPSPGRFEFDGLDAVMGKLADNGICVVLATPTAAHPAWLSRLHPEVLRSDGRGRRRHHGGRVNYCPTSQVYRDACAQIAGLLAERYGGHPALVLWHIHNEYGIGPNRWGACFCDSCAAAFRRWLQRKYSCLDELNRCWWSAFWSHTYTDWSQVDPPYEDGEQSVGALKLDYARFTTDCMIECYLNEKRVLNAVTPDVPCTTNMMGTYGGLDYHKWAPHLDVVSWDSYPPVRGDIALTGFMHDLNYGIKRRPYMLMEQTPSATNWQTVAALKPPGVLRLWSWMAVGHGADSVMYFQWRRSRGAHEMLHGAVVAHAGHEDTRVFREVAELGAELDRVGDSMLGARVDASVALVFDWENWWALDATPGILEQKDYRRTVFEHYRILWERNIPVAVLDADADFDGYGILIAPMLFLVGEQWASKAEAFVRDGGFLVMTCPTGWVDETILARPGYPGPLRKLLGVWIEEIDALDADQSNRIVMRQSFGRCEGAYECARMCEIVHPEGASVLGVYDQAFYAGCPAVTEHIVGEGRAYYIATDAGHEFLSDFYGALCRARGIDPVLETPSGVEVRRRAQGERSFLVALNHNPEQAEIDLGQRPCRDMLAERVVKGKVKIAAHGALVLEEPPDTAARTVTNGRNVRRKAR